MHIHDMTEEAYKNGYEAGVKKFAERLKKEKCDMVSSRNYCGHLYEITGSDIDDLVKEMTEQKE